MLQALCRSGVFLPPALPREWTKRPTNWRCIEKLARSRHKAGWHGNHLPQPARHISMKRTVARRRNIFRGFSAPAKNVVFRPSVNTGVVEILRSVPCFPDECTENRAARNALFVEPMVLCRHAERVAAQRRALPTGGAVAQDCRLVVDAGAAKLDGTGCGLSIDPPLPVGPLASS